MASRSNAFSLIELLVVIALVVILLGVLIVSGAQARRQAREAQCLSNLRQIASGFHLYADDNAGRLPDEWSDKTWDALLLRYLRDERLFACPADPKGLFQEVGASYEWRDVFQVDPLLPDASLGGAALAEVTDPSLVLVFDADGQWHTAGAINAAAVDTSARAYDLIEFERNLARPAQGPNH